MYKSNLVLCCVILLFLNCKTDSADDLDSKSTFKIVFGSCNNQDMAQDYWSVMKQDSADVFIWGGDNIYADTSDMTVMDSLYNVQKTDEFYQSFSSSLPNPVLGVWDDHDYGKNDAGKEWEYKVEAKALFMDFFDIDSTHAMASRDGTYYAETFTVGNHSVKIYLLDSRYFRDGLMDATTSGQRYQPHTTPDSTLLGNEQWHWLENEMKSSTADFNIIVSSIQFLSTRHGFETWGNFPYEINKLEALLEEHQLDNSIILSGDRHISEFSQKQIDSLDYPLTDFTSSGLTHSYSSFESEPNPYRIGEVVAQNSYGSVELNLKEETASLSIKSTATGEELQNLRIDF